MPDATTLPAKGDTIEATVVWHQRSCTRTGCNGTAGALRPDSGECIYLSRPTPTGRRDALPCGQPYTEADWRPANYVKRGTVFKIGKAISGLPLIYIKTPGGRVGDVVPWSAEHLASWRLA